MKDTDCLVLVTDRDIFKDINPWLLTVRNKNLINTRNMLNHGLWMDAGYKVKVLGNGFL